MKCALTVLNRDGDTTTVFDTDSAVDMTEFEAQFRALKGKGMLTYTTDEGGGNATVVQRFDQVKDAPQVFATPQLVGG